MIGPTQHEFLCPSHCLFNKSQTNRLDRHWFVKDEPDGLWPTCGRLPPGALVWSERIFNGMIRMCRRGPDGCPSVEVKPRPGLSLRRAVEQAVRHGCSCPGIEIRRALSW